MVTRESRVGENIQKMSPTTGIEPHPSQKGNACGLERFLRMT